VVECLAAEPELAEGEPVQFPEGTKAHRVLELGYLGNVKLSRQQIECAKHALPHENPRLGVIATTAMNADDFAATLDRAIARSGLLIEHRPDEGAKSPDPIPPRGSPRQGLFGSPDKRFRR
jgi:hypothetical protein